MYVCMQAECNMWLLISAWAFTKNPSTYEKQSSDVSQQVAEETEDVINMVDPHELFPRQSNLCPQEKGGFWHCSDPQRPTVLPNVLGTEQSSAASTESCWINWLDPSLQQISSFFKVIYYICLFQPHRGGVTAGKIACTRTQPRSLMSTPAPSKGTFPRARGAGGRASRTSRRRQTAFPKWLVSTSAWDFR